MSHHIYLEHRAIAVMHFVLALGFLFPRGVPVTGSATVLLLANLTPDVFALVLLLVGVVFTFVPVPFRIAPFLLLPLLTYAMMAVYFSLTQEPIRLLYPAGLVTADLIGCMALHFISIRQSRYLSQIEALQAAISKMKGSLDDNR